MLKLLFRVQRRLAFSFAGLLIFTLSTFAVRAAQHHTTALQTTPAQADWASPEMFQILAALCSVIGHSFPPWLKFKGGKGVATSAGALFGLVPQATVIGLAIWLLVFWLTRYVSLASVLTAVALPLVIFIINWRGETETRPVFYASLCIAAVVIWRHRSNLSRLIRGREPRFTRK